MDVTYSTWELPRFFRKDNRDQADRLFFWNDFDTNISNIQKRLYFTLGLILRQKQLSILHLPEEDITST